METEERDPEDLKEYAVWASRFVNRRGHPPSSFETWLEMKETLRVATAYFDLPTLEEGSQRWDKIDGAVAFHLIERHADNWADAGMMMDEWAKAQAVKNVAKWAALTDEDRDRAFQTLPDMLDGFMKKWGWLHFAKAIEDICREKNGHA